MSLSKGLSIYNFFNTSLDDEFFICKLCNEKLKKRSNGGTWNISRHLHSKHSGEITKSLSSAFQSNKSLNTQIVSPAISKQWFADQPNDINNIIPNNPNEISFGHANSSSPLFNSTNEINVNVEELKLIHPFSLIVSGPTSSGKSTLLFQILNNLHQNTTPLIEKIVYIYGIYQDIFKNYPNIFFTDNLDFMDCSTEVPTVIILDDLMSVLNNSKKLEELFTRGVHHRKVSVVLTLQNLFYHGGVMKTLRDNAMYIALTKHIQDVSKLDTFARQLESKNSNYFKDSYADAVSKKYGYLFCDLHPHSELRDGHFKIKYRSLIHKPDGQVLYLPKGQGMSKAVIHSDALENPEQVKALVKSGPTIPNAFKSLVMPSAVSTLIPAPLPVQQCPESAMIPYHPTNPTQNPPPLQHNMAIPASIQPTSVPSMQSVPLYVPKPFPTHTTPAPLESPNLHNLSMSSCNQPMDTSNMYPVGTLKFNKLRTLALVSTDEVYEVIKYSDLDFVQDFQKILKYLKNSENLAASPLNFLKTNMKCLRRVLEEKELAKKRKILLKLAQSGVIGILLHIMISVAAPVMPKLLEPSVCRPYWEQPLDNISETESDNNTSDDEISDDDTEDGEEGEMEEGEEEEETVTGEGKNMKNVDPEPEHVKFLRNYYLGQ